MQRIAAVWHASPLKLVGVLLALMLAAAMAVGSGASFNAQTTNLATFASGTLAHTNDKDGQVVLNLANMKPGASASSTVVVKNTGSLAATFTLARTALSGDAGLQAQINLKVEDVTGTPTTVYDGALNGSLGTPVALSPASWAVDDQRSYKLTATFSASAGNATQGKAAGATLTFESTPS